MAATAVAVASNVVENSRADKVVFSDKNKSELLPTPESKSPSKSTSGSDTPITPKDFYWDQILFYLVSGILGLSFLDISVEFFRGTVIQCFTPENITIRDQIAYLNNYCYGSLPNSQYYLIFILISALMIIAPHYLWMSYFGAHFDFFFDLVKKLNRLRDTSIGEYSPLNFELVKKLEEKFSKSNTWIFRLYKLKLCGQLMLSLIVLLFNALYFKTEDFNSTFLCPKDTTAFSTPIWPLGNQVTCVYNSLTLLLFLRNTALGLVSASVLVILFGLVWCFSRHTTELGAKDIAAFCDLSCLPPEEYPYPSLRKVLKKIISCGKEERLLGYHRRNSQRETDDAAEESEGGTIKCSPCFMGFWNGIKDAFFPRISNDLDFLLMRLFYADSGHGQVFKDIQIYKELNEKRSQDHELLYLLNIVHRQLLLKRIKQKREQLQRKRRGDSTAGKENDDFERWKDIKNYFFMSKFDNTNPEREIYSQFESKMGIALNDWSYSPLRSVLFGFLQFAPDNKLALDISFGNKIGHSLVLARAFYDVVTIHFNKHYKNQTETCKADNYQANYRTFTFQADIFSQNAKLIFQSEQLIIDLFTETVDGHKLDLIVIGPMTDRSKIVTANLLIEKLHAREHWFNKNAVLLAVRPLMIGSKPCTDRFIQYKPPEGIFEDINDQVNNALAASKVPVYSVSPKGDVKLVDLVGGVRRRQSILQRSRTLTRLMSAIGGNNTDPPPQGIAVQCNDVQCIYEFKVFRYTGIQQESPQPPSDLSLYDTTLSSDDVPTGSLVSPIMSPSLPDISHAALATATSNGCATSRSEPSLVDNRDIFNNETHV